MADRRVSAIVIVYNGAEFLRDAIASIVGQTLTDWELIVVDDGSTDQSASIAEEFVALRPDQIRLVRHEDCRNHGMSAARNLGIAQARGKYIAFLDADDEWLPNKLLDQVAVLEANPALGMVYGRTTIWYSWQSPPSGEDFHYALGVTPGRAYDPPILFENLLRNVYQTPTTCNALISRRVAIEVGCFDDAFKGMFEDQVFFAKVMMSAPVFVSDVVWAKYRQHADSASVASQSAGADESARLRFLRWTAGYLLRRRGVRIRTWLRFSRVFVAAWRDTLNVRKANRAGSRP
ncbi:glycosyltransferase family 2 protein [Bradyrhizobium jicamae]|uniref:Glycosyltransferase family 2 protein n=1 Tax=Bradyrhizobium jicamae TaxID=280332 RepID=A0ABS5FK32_9BRAD|nr:glycosyltransferase family 2 protein [Bradyrhizobium jicamae]MBR0797138.1 glycosyltransferase family 2 protein [Bradyrhizobium jicamae]MBR0934949.1 glycosyltransferase family 2 protein [Bradyrhizobium jicamae]